MTPQLSLIISVYNKPKNLEFIFAALSRQSFCAFEVIVADDGSGPEITSVVEDARKRYPFPIMHLWHEDKGWRKNTILNKAVQASTTDYLVFIDGDCIPGKNFLLDHFNYRENDRVLLGRRVEHWKRWAKRLSVENVLSGNFEHYTLADWIDGLRGRSIALEVGFRIGNDRLRRLTGEVSSILGSNFSVYKEHLIVINGYDEEYHGAGCGEDSDIFYRLGLIGIRGKSLRCLAIQYHIYHPLMPRLEENIHRFEKVKERKESRCRNGIVAL